MKQGAHSMVRGYFTRSSSKNITRKTLATSRYNKNVAGKKGVSPGWRMNLDEEISV